MAITSSNMRAVATVLALIAVVVAMLMGLYFPTVPKSALGWLALIVIGLPTWIVLELLGEAVLGNRFMARRSPGGRILLAVPVLIVLVVVGSGLVWLGRVVIEWL